MLLLIGANGDVSNAEFGYLASVSSDIQAQLDAKGSGTMSQACRLALATGRPQLQAARQMARACSLLAGAQHDQLLISTSDAGSAVLTFAFNLVSDPASASGNAFRRDLDRQ